MSPALSLLRGRGCKGLSKLQAGLGGTGEFHPRKVFEESLEYRGDQDEPSNFLLLLIRGVEVQAEAVGVQEWKLKLEVSDFRSITEQLDVWMEMGDKQCPSGAPAGTSAVQYLHQ